jgi:hypothetical protein
MMGSIPPVTLGLRELGDDVVYTDVPVMGGRTLIPALAVHCQNGTHFASSSCAWT